MTRGLGRGQRCWPTGSSRSDPQSLVWMTATNVWPHASSTGAPPLPLPPFGLPCTPYIKEGLMGFEVHEVIAAVHGSHDIDIFLLGKIWHSNMLPFWVLNPRASFSQLGFYPALLLVPLSSICLFLINGSLEFRVFMTSLALAIL
ncbi:hypothetical protein EJB05_52016 [Eragrostis curvula]|uniref:Uncharacterized protein n=1 Tax=Eragrostis curvula TaxID=38414 RepID=A0A5J9SU29_9POAL|nr:hypothetical protein EJB05_52016 [Eragrostis curvula]